MSAQLAFADLNVFKWGIFSAREKPTGFEKHQVAGMDMPLVHHVGPEGCGAPLVLGAFALVTGLIHLHAHPQFAGRPHWHLPTRPKARINPCCEVAQRE